MTAQPRQLLPFAEAVFAEEKRRTTLAAKRMTDRNMASLPDGWSTVSPVGFILPEVAFGDDENRKKVVSILSEAGARL